MSELDKLFKKLPADTRELLTVLWDTLPLGDKAGLLSLLKGLPSNTTMLRSLVRLSTVQLKITMGQKNKVVIVGPANVGKSTLYNQFIQQKMDQAEVGPLPGTTRVNRASDAGLFSIIDTPGADTVGLVGEHERDEALSAAANADFLIIMFDAIQGIKQTELDLYHKLTALSKPYIVVLNKIDLVRKHQQAVITLAAESLGLQQEQVIPLAASNGQNINQVLSAIAIAEPQIVVALARAMPAYRWQLAWRTIVSAASASAVVALTPIPLLDFIPLVAIQSIMVLGIARIYNYEITPSRAKELITTFGLGFLARSIFNELSKLGGIPGWLLSAAIATATTVTMGYASRVWFEKGEKVSSETLKHITRTVSNSVIESLRGIANKKPGKKSLQLIIADALEKSYGGEIELPQTGTPSSSADDWSL